MSLLFRFLTNYEASLLSARYFFTAVLLFGWIPGSTSLSAEHLPFAVGYYMLTSLLLHLVYGKTPKRWRLWHVVTIMDLPVVSTLVYESGGLQSDLYFCYFLAMAMASYMHKWTQAFSFTLLTNLCYLLTLLLMPGSLDTQAMVMRLALFAIISIVFPVNALVEQKRIEAREQFSQIMREKEGLIREKEGLIREMESISRQVADYTFDLHKLAVTDQLTALYNHTYLHSQLVIEVEKSKQTGKPLSLMLLDIDNFKRVNDTHGHLIGDEVLKAIAKCLTYLVENTYNTPCRAGGEELAVIMPDKDMEEAYQFADHLRQEISQLGIPLSDGDLLFVSVSVGVATFPTSCQTHQQLIDCADQAMYVAKSTGKNRTCRYTPPMAQVEEGTQVS